MTEHTKNPDRFITIAILTIWTGMILFGILTLVSPNWLENLSNPGMNAEAIYIKNAGDIQLKENHPEKAISLYKSAIKIVPDYHAAIANMAIAFQKSGDLNKAISSYKYLLENNPEQPEIIYYNLAEIEEKIGDLSKAKAYYKLAAESSPYPQNAYQRAGKIAMDEGLYAEAISFFKKSLAHKMTLENSYRAMLIKEKKASAQADTLVQLPNNYIALYDKSIFNYQLAHDNELAKTFNNLGVCEAKTGQYKEAIDYLNQALAINPAFKDALNNKKIVETMIKTP